jgi:uncharacterized phage infection (PIP) family protein YhgE
MAALLPRAARADLVGDVGVLLAQLEQQLQMVSHAISTVQNLVQTVKHLSSVVDQGKRLLEQAGRGNIEGVLNAAQGFTRIGMNVTGRLRMTHTDVNWWRTKLTPLLSDSNAQLSTADRMALESDLRAADRERMSGAKRVNAWYDRLQEQYKILEAQSTSVQEGSREQGAVAAMQRAHAATALAHQTAVAQLEMATVTAEGDEMERVRQAAERERSKKIADQLMKGFSYGGTPKPVENAGPIRTGSPGEAGADEP